MEISNQKGEQIHANVLSRPYNKKKDCVKDKGALIQLPFIGTSTQTQIPKRSNSYVLKQYYTHI